MAESTTPVIEHRKELFVTKYLSERKDLKGVKKFSEHPDLESFITKLKEYDVNIIATSVVDDSQDSINNFGQTACNLFAAGLSFDEHDRDHTFFLASNIDNGVPIIIISNKETQCDFIKLELDTNNKIVKNYYFECLKPENIKTVCPDYINAECMVKSIKNEALLRNLQLLMGRFPELIKSKRIPIFNYSYFCDFMVWQKLVGEEQQKRRILNTLNYNYRKEFTGLSLMNDKKDGE
jgi:hypothetical protein